MKSLKIVIACNKEMIKKKYDANKFNLYWRAYFDESDQNEDVIATSMKANWSIEKRLEGVEITLTHHDELERLTRTMKKLSKHCETFTNSRKRIYKMYSNN